MIGHGFLAQDRQLSQIELLYTSGSMVL